VAADLYDAVAAERRRLADCLDALSDDEWLQPSLCAGWRVRDVFAHLLSVIELGPLDGLRVIVRCGFNLNKANDRVATSDNRPPAELLTSFRSHADKRFHPPGFGPEAPLTDLTVHGGDMLRPLGRPHQVPADIALTLLPFLTSTRGQVGFGKRGRLDGVTLRAVDVEWSHGDGPDVTGSAEALIMMMTGRSVAFDDLSGDGVASLRSRFD
jgi:uncharacterized protein (TIGR03083 family)